MRDRVPLLFLLAVGMTAGCWVALAGGAELSRETGPLWRTAPFSAFGTFVGFVLVPAASYFAWFHPAWFFHYAVGDSAARWPAVVLQGALVAGVALGAFWVAAVLLRRGKPETAHRVALGLALGSVLIWPIGWSRFSVVGSARQYALEYGLEAYTQSKVFYAGVAFALVMAIAITMLVRSLRARERL